MSYYFNQGYITGIRVAEQTDQVPTNTEWVSEGLGILPDSEEAEAEWLRGCRTGFRHKRDQMHAKSLVTRKPR